MRVDMLCNRSVVCVRENESVVEAARRMRERHVGNLVVVADQNGRAVPVGILTDRDIVVGVVAKDPEHILTLDVGDILVDSPVTACEDEDIAAVIDRMQRLGVRRMPIVSEKGALVGILTLDDVLGVLSRDMARVAELVATQRDREAERRV